MKKDLRQRYSQEFLIHISAWIFLFGVTPMLIGRTNEQMYKGEFIRMMGTPIVLGIIFYTNYLHLVPHYLFQKKYKTYVIINAILCLFMLIISHIWFEICNLYFPFPRVKRPAHTPPSEWVFILFRIRDFIIFGFTAALGATIRMSKKWRIAEVARQKAELKRTEAELKNLRNQINPHFLLNTLNNIYALIAFDTDKAQQAVQDLSRLLRHILYDNNMDFTPINRELEFLKNYVALMKIRLSDDVDIQFRIDIPEKNNIRIAPLIYISLVENAFKHGISLTQNCFIHIHIYYEEPDRLCLRIDNSNYPKTRNDISGSGIGLEQVKRRLELIYPEKYEWKKGTNESQTVYTSLLIIQTSEL